jgi:hypothetical protein
MIVTFVGSLVLLGIGVIVAVIIVSLVDDLFNRR